MSPDQGPITVVLATDSYLLGDGLASLLADVDDVEVVGRARNHLQLIDRIEELEPEAAIISIRTPLATSMTTIEAARRLRVEHPGLGIVVISDRGNGFALELLRGGGRGSPTCSTSDSPAWTRSLAPCMRSGPVNRS